MATTVQYGDNSEMEYLRATVQELENKINSLSENFET